MLLNTFIHFPGVGAKREKALWTGGVLTWDDFERTLSVQTSLQFEESSDPVRIAIDKSRKALEKEDFDFFARHLPKSEHYRIALAAFDRTAFVDIETTGLSHYYDDITIIGVGLNHEYRYFIKGQSDNELAEFLSRSKCIMTFNGTLFDLKFLRRDYPSLPIPLAHVDLRFFLKRLGYAGGQKAIESQLNIKRDAEIDDIRGEIAPELWHQYRRGDLNAGNKLIQYNRADVNGMRKLFEIALPNLLSRNEIPAQIRRSLLFPSRQNSAKTNLASWNRSPKVSAYQGHIGPRVDFKTVTSGFDAENLRIVGIDLTGSERRPSGYCLLSGRHAETKLLDTDQALINAAVAAKPHLISIDSPLSLPRGRTRVTDDDKGRKEFGIMRECERTLKRRGVNVYPCLINSMQNLTARGIRLASTFRKMGIPVIESYPGAAQDIMGIPRKGKGLEYLKNGLKEFGIVGKFLDQKVSHDEADAVTSAIVGIFFWAGKFEAIGNEQEDYLIIPDLEKSSQNWCERIVIGISGLIAAGKTSAANIFARNGFVYRRYSQTLSEILKQSGEIPFRQRLQEFGLEVHKKFGQRWLGNQLIKSLSDQKRIVIDGIRFPEDYAFLVETFGPAFHHLHIAAPLEVRRKRYLAMGNEKADFELADTHEVESQISQLVGLAHKVVVNDTTLDKLVAQVSDFIFVSTREDDPRCQLPS